MKTRTPRHATGCRTHYGRRVRSSERGSALIIALLVILALTGMGLIGLKQSTTELRSSSNYRFTKQGLYTGHAAMAYTVNTVGRNPAAYAKLYEQIQTNLEAAGVNQAARVQITRATSTSDQMIFGIKDTVDCTPSTWWSDPGCQGLEGLAGYLVTPSQLPSFRIDMLSPVDGPRAPGFGQNFCFQRFTFDGSAWVGGLPTGFVDAREPAGLVMTRARAQALVGPIDCSSGYYGG